MTKTIATLFSCGGGFDLGALAAGYTPVFALDFDAKALASYILNLGNHAVCADVRGYDFTGIKANHLHVSPSCKSSSSANKNRGETLFDIECALAICKALIQINPDTFTLENVVQYVNMQPFDGKTNAFHKILEQLQKLGYKYQYKTLNAADYGVPQTRKRLILMASKHYYPTFPEPTHSKPSEQQSLFSLPNWISWYNAISDLIPALKKTDLAPWQRKAIYENTLFHGTSKGNNFKEVHTVSSTCPAFTLKATDYKGLPKIALIEKVGARGDRPLRQIDQHSPCPTLKSLDGRTWEQWVIQNEVEILQSDIRCLARWQSFPEWYQFPKSRSVACSLIGNSVPPLLSQRIMETFG